uniref:Ribonuclease H-like domain-containing protein n=1 Tax=Tanacetum cinerariifolium TaxID=118510 RepID=A0A699JJ29_TANCI|nr:ribonuclease H-like domain-containing protein [Tanacetum cinerariifolium]
MRCLWLLRHKFHADGSLSRYKARLIANGSSQHLGIDCDETFSPVVKSTTILTVLSLAFTRHWPVHQLGVKNAFLNGDLFETMYMHQPSGFVDAWYPHHVCRLQRSGTDTTYLLIYVDDIVLTASFTALLQQIIFSLHIGFDMAYLGALNYFLRIFVTRDTTWMFLAQKKYAMKLPKRAHMLNCNLTRTLVDTESKLGPEGTFISDPTLYRSLPAALKRIIRYVQGTLEFGLQLYASSRSSLVAYSDADWAGCPATRRSTFGYCVFLGNNLLSLSSKRQPTLSRSSAEAEYQSITNAVVETACLRNLLRELHIPLLTATLMYCDNVSAVYLSANPVQHQRTKHIEIDIHFVHDMVSVGQVRVLHVPSRYEYANIFTKGLPSALFEEFRTSLSVRLSPAQTAREC